LLGVTPKDEIVYEDQEIDLNRYLYEEYLKYKKEVDSESYNNRSAYNPIGDFD